MNAKIRKASIDDFESIYNLISDLESHLMDNYSFKTTFAKNLNNHNIYYLVAILENKIVGFISLHVQNILHHSKPTEEIQELIIDSKFRGSGIGGLLIAEVEGIAQNLNLEEIELTTHINREKAQHFYCKFGYEHTHNKYVKKLN
ncbi:MAG: GNAT family N-acetyltransferase [Tenuifilaceae bacterium]